MNAVSEATDEEIKSLTRLSQRTINNDKTNNVNKLDSITTKNNEQKIKRDGLSPEKPPRQFHAKNSITSDLSFTEDSETASAQTTLNQDLKIAELKQQTNETKSLLAEIFKNDKVSKETILVNPKPLQKKNASETVQVNAQKPQKNLTNSYETVQKSADSISLQNLTDSNKTVSKEQENLTELSERVFKPHQESADLIETAQKQELTVLNNQNKSATDSNRSTIFRKSSTISTKKADSENGSKTTKMYENCGDSESSTETTSQSNLSISSSEFDTTTTINDKLNQLNKEKLKKSYIKLEETDVSEKTEHN